MFDAAGLQQVLAEPLVVPMTFSDFDELWSPFLGGQGPAPSYLVGLTAPRRAAAREALRTALPVDHDGAIHLTARAWCVRGRHGQSVRPA
jgi:hypothetical protein